MNIYKTFFGKRLRQARSFVGMKQHQLAEAIGVEPASVSLWESGKNFPEPIKLSKLAKVLKVSVDDLCGIPALAQNQMPSRKSDLIVAIIAILPTLNETQLRGLFHSLGGEDDSLAEEVFDKKDKIAF